MSDQSCPSFHPSHAKQVAPVITQSPREGMNIGHICVRISGAENFTTAN